MSQTATPRTPDSWRVFFAAEAVVVDPASTDVQVKAAVAQVDALGEPAFSNAIRRTLTHEANHRE
jgi:hypothetical protein